MVKKPHHLQAHPIAIGGVDQRTIARQGDFGAVKILSKDRKTQASPLSSHTPRRRLPREERTGLILAVAWKWVGDEETDKQTLGRLVEAAAVTKEQARDEPQQTIPEIGKRGT